jgi:hypothetical protein
LLAVVVEVVVPKAAQLLLLWPVVVLAEQLMVRMAGTVQQTLVAVAAVHLAVSLSVVLVVRGL